MSDYGVLSRALHRLALGVSSVSEASFDIERNVYGRSLPSCAAGKHVFVAGLARSGTTLLMRALHETGEFCSLTYRDMPFVLAPNLWAGLAGRGARHKEAAVRAHGDGVLVDFDSPEALEDVFWRVFCGDRYIRHDRLCPMDASAEDLDRFRCYVSLILKRYSGDRYLSKNNNNVLRLEAIHEAFPDSLILIPYRDPGQHAYSLLKQHRRFLEMHNDDSFSASYMTWLVHHEFGSDHRPFEWGHRVAAGRDIMSIEYWLAQWVGVYGHLLSLVEKFKDSLLPVGYEMFCSDTQSVWTALSNRAGFSAETPANLDLRVHELPEISDKQLLRDAREIFLSLETLAKRWMDIPAETRRNSGFNGVPKGIRTPVTAVKGRCPGPLDDGDTGPCCESLVELGGIEPPTSCMPCKRSPS